MKNKGGMALIGILILGVVGGGIWWCDYQSPENQAIRQTKHEAARYQHRANIGQRYVDLERQYRATGYLDESARNRLNQVIEEAKAERNQCLYGSTDYIGMNTFAQDFTDSFSKNAQPDITHFEYPPELPASTAQLLAIDIMQYDADRYIYRSQRERNPKSAEHFKVSEQSLFVSLRAAATTPSLKKQVASMIKHFYD